MRPRDRPVYVPPTGDEPLDEIEQAIVRAMVAIITRESLEEEEAEARTAGRGHTTDLGQ
jgi:hypothetical protein